MKRAQNLKRASRIMKGLVIKWDDPAPLKNKGAIINDQVTHKNAVLRLEVSAIWRQHKRWITEAQPFLWRVTVTTVFSYENGTDQHESRLFIGRYRLMDIAEACEPEIRDMLKYGKNPTMSHFSCECLGNREARDSDYSDYEAA